MTTRLWRWVFVCGIFFSAYEAMGVEPIPVAGFNDALKIPPNEIPSLTHKAETGDRAAAEQLSSYYGFYVDDMDKFRYYLELAAKQRSPMALRSLVTIYSTHPDFFDFERALLFRRRLKKLSQETGMQVKSDTDWGYEFYLENFVARGNKERGLIFLEYAANHGSEKARNELIEIYSNDPDVRNPQKARYWKQRSRLRSENQGGIKVATKRR